jgi:hypothetical protein
MNKRKSLSKAEIVLIILALIGIPLYGVALFKGGGFVWWFVGDALVMLALAATIILPNLLKQMMRKEKRKQRAGVNAIRVRYWLLSVPCTLAVVGPMIELAILTNHSTVPFYVGIGFIGMLILAGSIFVSEKLYQRYDENDGRE